MNVYSAEFDPAVVAVAKFISTARGARDGGSFFSPGDVSSLRRMNPDIPIAACWRLLNFLPRVLWRTEEEERRWAITFTGMALMSAAVHDSNKAPGTTLASTAFSSSDRPIRINRLLKAEDSTFDDLFIAACRFLAAKGQAVDWRSFARFALLRDDQQRKRVARDFYSWKPTA